MFKSSKSIKALMMGLALTATTAVTTPAMAQMPYHPGPAPVAGHGGAQFYDRLSARVSELRSRIDGGLRDRQLTRNEYQRLSGQLNSISTGVRQAQRSRGVSRAEFDTLNGRLDRLAGSIHFERHDMDRPGPHH